MVSASSKYIAIANEIERFIDSKKEEPKHIKGNVTEINDKLITIKIKSSKGVYLSRGALVLIDAGLPDIFASSITAFVVEKSESTLKLEVKRDVNKLLNRDVRIDCSRTNVILERLGEVVQKIKENELDGDNIRVLNSIIGIVNPEYSKDEIKLSSKKLNADQQEAILRSLQTNDFHLIIGPPGTGKTHTIIKLINQLLKKKQKLLITAWTNVAVDNIVERLVKQKVKIVRLGPINEIKPKLRKYSIFEKIKEHQNWEEIEAGEQLVQKSWEIFNNVNQEFSDAQKEVEKLRTKKELFVREQSKLLSEKRAVENILKLLVYNNKKSDLSRIKRNMVIVENRANSFLDLATKMFKLKQLEKRLPSLDTYRSLKMQVKNLKLQLLSKQVLFFMSKGSELKELRRTYNKKQKMLDKMVSLIRQVRTLKAECNTNFKEVYAKEGQPDKDALKFYTKLLNMLLKEYLPSKKDEIQNSLNKQTLDIEKDVYSTYITSLERQIELKSTQIATINTELFAQINKRESLKLKKHNLLETIKYYKKNLHALRKQAMQAVISNADVITSTAISSCNYYLDDTLFDVMIMDEASQVASFMSLLPLLKCKKFILVGDNKQLQPIVEGKIGQKLDLSIFNRLFDMYPTASTLLTVQHRMHKKIADIASEVFYEGKIKTSREVAERIISIRGKKKHLFLNSNVPVAFIDTCNVQYYEDEIGGSCANTGEAKYTAYVVSLFIKNGVKQRDIGVITPYIKQKVLIRELLSKLNIEDVEVDTVHKYQGREKDVIIMSFSRSKKFAFPDYKLKFIENKTLVNVAITRAKKKLILIGNSKTLERSALLKSIFEKIGKENTITLN